MTFQPVVKMYCTAHVAAKRILGKEHADPFSCLYAYEDPESLWRRLALDPAREFLNDGPAPDGDYTGGLFYGSNIVPRQGGAIEQQPPRSNVRFEDAESAWKYLLEASLVPEGWKNAGLHAVCYSKATGQWCLSSWIWTSAAIARCYARMGNLDGLRRIADEFLARQHSEGGWLVRFDRSRDGVTPLFAPNDSAYIARNAMLCAYEAFGEEKYLDSAKKCAQWIMDTARSDGTVYFGADANTGSWITDVNIVDTGFTADLIARLYEITGFSEYKRFLSLFINSYVENFWNAERGLFSTVSDNAGHRSGGFFARGQAWALEGLMPACAILREGKWEHIAQTCIENVLKSQSQDGSWRYNFAKRFSGSDSKGTPVLASVLARWGGLRGDERCLKAARMALTWCAAHTDLQGVCPGGIFSYCLEGDLAGHHACEAAFVYGSSYALETYDMLAKNGIDFGGA